jgi:D-psicose/D-tagatose/L-ribulose 3-epimerase
MTHPLRFACSNIAWSGGDEAAALAFLHGVGVRGIELAPSVVWPGWDGATPAAARDYAARCAGLGFEIASMQALLFGCPRALLFADDGGAAFEAQLARCAGLGEALGARAAVLGAPKQRQRGALSAEAAADRAAPVLQRAARRFADAGMVLALEPARPEDAGDFLVDTREVIAFVDAHASPGLGVHLDAAAMHLAGEALAATWPLSRHGFVHYQLSEPALGDFVAPRAPQAANLAFLRSQAWPHWCSVEMRASPLGLAAAGPWALIEPYLG